MLRFEVQLLAALLSLGVSCGVLAANNSEPLEDTAVKEGRPGVSPKGRYARI
jgi:hypothetical protein